MRILYHHRTQGSGAAGNHIRQVVKALRALGHTVDVVSPSGVNVMRGSQRPERPAPRSGPARMLREMMELGYNVVMWWRLQRVHRAERYDLVYERYAIFGLAGLVAASRRGIPVILEVNFTCRTPVHPPRTPWFQHLAVRIDRLLFHRVSGIVVVSTTLKRHLMREFGVPGRKIVVTPNAVDPEQFAGPTPGRAVEAVRERLGMNGRRVVGFVGGFYPWHGLPLLIDAAQAVLAERKNVCFLLVGDGAQRAELQRRVKQRGLEEAVIFTGRVPHQDVPGYIASFDIGVMPDSNEYGSPLKILEYMGMGKAVVAPRLGPIEEIVDDRSEGLLFRRGSVREMAKAIVTLLKDQGLRRQLGSGGRRRVMARHTWTHNVRAILDFYDTHVGSAAVRNGSAREQTRQRHTRSTPHHNEEGSLT